MTRWYHDHLSTHISEKWMSDSKSAPQHELGQHNITLDNENQYKKEPEHHICCAVSRLLLYIHTYIQVRPM